MKPKIAAFLFIYIQLSAKVDILCILVAPTHKYYVSQEPFPCPILCWCKATFENINANKKQPVFFQQQQSVAKTIFLMYGR